MPPADLPEEPTRGLAVDDADPAIMARAIEMAFRYRGDVTLWRRGADEPLEGYIFDRRLGETPSESVIRLMPGGDDDGDGETVSIPYADVRRLEFSGRDAAAGKSFETWVKKYVQKKLAGEEASIESDPLE